MALAFQPQGQTVLVAASSSTGLAPTQISGSNVTGCLLTNASTVSIYLALGSSSIAASVPTTAASALGCCLPAGAQRAFNVGPSPSGTWLSAVTSAGAAVPGLYATPGS